MAELEIRQLEESIYSNVEEKEVIPLFIRYTSKNTEFHDKTASVPFDNIVSMLSGIHTCIFIHRKQKGRNAKEYDELSIKIDEESFCIAAQLSRDEFSLREPRFSQKNMVLPEEKEQYLVRKCDIRFVDLFDDTLKLFNSTGSYWVGHTNDVKEFIASCFALPIPPIEIRIEEDKEMWQAYLEGLNAILENKRDLIKISSVHNQKGGLIKLIFDMESYGENLKNAIIEKLSSQCEQKFDVEIGDGECHISFDSYQAISEEIIEDIKAIGRDYCYTSESNPINVVSGKIVIVSNPDELSSILSAIDQELHDFGTQIERTDSDEFKLSSDKDFEFLHKIVETNYKGIAEVVPTTKMIMRLLPSPGGIDIEKIKAWLPDSANVVPHGKHFVVSSKKPLDTSLEVFKNLQFASCMVSISPSKSIDTTITIEGATIKGNAYQWIINDFHELNGLGRLFNEVRKVYTNQYINSTFHYAFAPQIDRVALQELKLNNYGKKSVVVDVPRSCVIFTPQSEEDYKALREDILLQLDSAIIAEAPSYEPTAKIEFLCENEDYRRSLFERVNVSLADKRDKFSKNKLSRDARELAFEFRFGDIEERDAIEKVLEDSLVNIHGIKILYDDNKKGVTEWSFTEDPSLLQELDRKLQSDFRNEAVNHINGKAYDKLDEIDDEEIDKNYLSKDKIIKRKKTAFLRSNSQNIGVCIKRCRDYAIIELTEEVAKALSTKEFAIRTGDYIQFPAMGETMELMRQSNAMNRILKPENRYNHRPINPNLPNFIFDPKYAAETVADIVEAMEDIRVHKIGNLNEKQLEAVTKSVLANDIALIQGPPGTGKTTVIAEIIWQAIRYNPDCRILLTSQTNLAVDNALERLQGQAGIRPIRIGRPEKLEPEGRRFSLPIIKSWAEGSDKYSVNKELELDATDNASQIWIDRIINKISNDTKYSDAVKSWKTELLERDKFSRIEFSRLYKSHVNLVAATCSICGSRDFEDTYTEMFGETRRQDMYFDIVIMDEASKATPLEMAVPLVLGKKIIVIGDHKQLPPMMNENTIDSALEKIGKKEKELADKLKNADSQFKRLFESAAKVRKSIVSTLDTQYRMHEQIMNTIKQFYQEELAETGGLKCGIVDTMDNPDLSDKGSRWHGITLDPIITPSTHAVWIDVQTQEQKPANSPFSYINKGELEAIDLLLRGLEKAEGFDSFMDSQKKSEDKEIGIITFYSAQSKEIKKKYKGKNYRMDVVDRFQGMERNIIIVSTVRSNSKNNIGFAREIERINVAFSRARRLLIVVGNKRQFESNTHYAASIQKMKTFSFEQLKGTVR